MIDTYTQFALIALCGGAMLAGLAFSAVITYCENHNTSVYKNPWHSQRLMCDRRS